MPVYKIVAFTFVTLLLLILPGCWGEFRGNPAHTGYDAYEHTLGPENVRAGLVNSWTGAADAVGDPMGPISSSPAVAAVVNGSASAEYVFIGSEYGYLYAFSALGCGGSLICGPVWSSYLGDDITDSSPAVAEEMINGVETSVVYVVANRCSVCGSLLYALNATNGNVIWEGGLYGEPAYSSPNVVGSTVYVAAANLFGGVLAFDATGTQSCTIINQIDICSPLWIGLADTDSASPAVSDGVLYIGGYSLYAYNATSGAALWQGIGLSQQQGGFNSSPAVADATVNGNPNPVVYVGSEDGYLYAYDANGIVNCSIVRGNQVCNPLWVGAGAGEIKSSPAVAPPTGAATSGVVYVGGTGQSPNNLFAYDANGVTNCSIVGQTQTCQPLWQGTTNGLVISSPAVANGVVYVGSSDGNLYAFAAAGCNATVCSSLSTFLTNDNGGNSSPAVSGGFVYIGSSDGYLYVLGPPPACAYSYPYC